MQIGWLIPTIGTFGSVREMVEISNVLVKRGHEVVIYTPEGGHCVWLPCATRYGSFKDLLEAKLDVLIGIIDWKPSLYGLLERSDAKLKAFCFMGFTPSKVMAEILKGQRETDSRDLQIIRECIANDFLVLADSSWQLDWIRENAISDRVGVPFGGVNISMFHPDFNRKSLSPIKTVGYSGDPRDRKGTDVVEESIEYLKQKDKKFTHDHYWKKGYNQEQLVEFLQSKDIFLDAHRRAGWCNPVAEAMACGTVPVCTNIGAVHDFAIHEKTALVVPVDNAQAMADAAYRLMTDHDLRYALITNGIDHIQQYSYETVAPKLEACLESYLG